MRGSLEDLPLLFFGKDHLEAVLAYSLFKLMPCEAIRQKRIVEDCRCPDSEIHFILSVRRDCSQAEALGAGQDIVGGLGPAEAFRDGIGGLDTGFDRRFEAGD